MKKYLVFFLLISIIFTGCAGNTAAQEGEENPGPQEITYVKVAAVETVDFTDSLSLPGLVKPGDEVKISAKISGTVAEINVDIGSEVKRDDILCRIEDTSYRLQYNKALTDLNVEKIGFGDLEKAYQRSKALYEVKAISQADFESMESQYQTGKENLDRAGFDFELARENLLDTQVKTPLSGIISLKDISKGEMAAPGNVIFTVVNTDSVYVEAEVSEEYIGLIKKGQKVAVKIAALGDETFTGSITNIGPVPDAATKTYPLKVLVENKDHILKAGMYANIDILTDIHQNVAVVPKTAVLTEKDRKYLFVEEHGQAKERNVLLGSANQLHYEVKEGVTKGERVIIRGHNNLKDGSPVKVK